MLLGALGAIRGLLAGATDYGTALARPSPLRVRVTNGDVRLVAVTPHIGSLVLGVARLRLLRTCVRTGLATVTDGVGGEAHCTQSQVGVAIHLLVRHDPVGRHQVTIRPEVEDDLAGVAKSPLAQVTVHFPSGLHTLQLVDEVLAQSAVTPVAETPQGVEAGLRHLELFGLGLEDLAREVELGVGDDLVEEDLPLHLATHGLRLWRLCGRMNLGLGVARSATTLGLGGLITHFLTSWVGM